MIGSIEILKQKTEIKLLLRTVTEVRGETGDMAGIVINKDTRVIFCGPQVLIIKEGCERLLDIPVPVIKSQEEENGASEGGGKELQEAGAAVSAVALSPAGDLLAVCDDRKQVCVFRLSDLRETSNMSHLSHLNICAY